MANYKELNIAGLKPGRRGDSWWCFFQATEPDLFVGPVFHAHISTPKDWRDIVKDYTDWAAAIGALGAVFGPPLVGFLAVTPGILMMASGITSNRDGSHDFFAFYEDPRRKRFLAKLRPFYFAGFVPDQKHKPIIRLPGLALLLRPSGVRNIADAYREMPQPPAA
jgi:hypothetical protein